MHRLAIPYSKNDSIRRCPVCRGFWARESQLEALRQATFLALDQTFDRVEAVGVFARQEPNIVVKAQRYHARSTAERLRRWLRRLFNAEQDRGE